MRYLLILFFATNLFAAADLEIRSVKAEFVPTHRAHITIESVNNGPEQASSIGCNVYIYSRQQLLISQNFALKALASGEARTDQIQTDLPESAQVNSIKVEIYDSVQPDIQPSTNYRVINVKVSEIKTADIQIVEAALENPEQGGAKLAIRVKMRNNGPDESANTRIQSDLLIFKNSVAKGEKNVGALNSGEEVDLRIPLAVPANTSATEGTIQLSWTFEETRMTDPDLRNNTYLLPLQVTPLMPDLAPLNIKNDARGNLNFMIHNRGNAQAPSTTAALYINGALVRRFTVPALAAGAKHKVNHNSGKVTETMKIAIVSDFNADAIESSEENNRIEFTPQPKKPQ